jgi:nicotinamidase-related amidase
MMPTSAKVGLDALLTPENCVVLLIDHQPSQLANVNSHDPTMVINAVTAVAKTAKAYDIPTILTTINAKRGDEIFKQIQAGFPDQKPIERSFINSWEDGRVVEAVKKTGRKKAGDRRTLVGDVSCAACHPRDGRRLRRVRRHRRVGRRLSGST